MNNQKMTSEEFKNWLGSPEASLRFAKIEAEGIETQVRYLLTEPLMDDEKDILLKDILDSITRLNSQLKK